MILYLAQLCCNASKEVPIKRISLLLGLVLIVGNLFNGLLAFCLIFLKLSLSKITYVLLGLFVNFLLFLILNKWLNKSIYDQLTKKRKLISEKQNFKYQLILLTIILVSIVIILIGIILGFELR